MYNRKAQATLGAAVLLAIGAPVLAQSAGMFDKPLKAGGASGQGTATARAQGSGSGQGQSHVSISKSDGGDRYEVEINNDQVTARVNGKEVPKDRIRRTGETLEILDKDGDVLTSFQVSTGPGGPGGHGGHGAATGLGGGNFEVFSGPGGATYFTPGQSGAFGGPVGQQGKPRVMLGVTMTESDDEEAQGVVLGSVSEGLPAAKAGLKKGDVIVSFDGHKDLNTAKVRELLAKKQAGDKAKIVVLRKGDEKTYTVELQPFDQSRFSGQMKEEALAAAQAHREAGRTHEEARKQMERAMKDLEKQKGLSDEAREEMRHAIEQSMKAMEADGNARAFVFGPGGQRFEMLTPSGPEMKDRLSTLDKRLAELDEKVSRLDQQLDRLEKKLDRLNERGR